MFVIRHYEHPSTTFRELNSTQVTLNKKSHLAFTTKKDPEITRVLRYMDSISKMVFHEMTETFHRISNSGRGASSFTINNNQLIEELKMHFLEKVPAPGSATAPIDQPWGAAEVALDKSSIEKVSRICSSYFQKSQYLFSVADGIEPYDDYVRQAVRDLYQEVYDSFKVKKIEIPSSFSAETLREFEVPKGMTLRNPRKMPCYSFAYMQVKEKRATSIIFEESDSDEPIRNIFAQLKEWKYQSIDWPIAGDLVVYVKGKKPTHVGVYQASGKVLSKLGINNPTAREHEIFDVPLESYGRRVLFFRKPSRTV